MMIRNKLLTSVVFVISFCLTENMMYDQFENFRRCPTFVDKTLLIKEFLNDGNKTLVLTAPDGFGKTTNLQMMRIFLTKDSNLTQVQNIFQNTNIAEDTNFLLSEMRNHSVIYCSFKQDKPIVDHKTLIRAFRGILHRTFSLHPYLARSSKLTGYDKKRLTFYTGVKKHLKMRPFHVLVGLNFLSEMLEAHHGRKVVLIIDDFDSVIIDSLFINDLEYETVLGFHNALLRVTLEENNHLSKSLLTGMSCISVKPLQRLVAFQCISFLENTNYSPFFGLTEQDLDKVLEKTEFINLRRQKPDIKKWYGGYTSPDYRIQVYNTRSVMSFLKSGEFKNYWVGTRAGKILKYLLIEPIVQQLFNDSIYHLPIKVRTKNLLSKIKNEHLIGIKSFSVNELWNENFADLFIRLLAEKGYYTFVNGTRAKNKDKKLTIKIPNKEMSNVFSQIQKSFLEDSTELLDRLKEAVRQASFPVTDKEEIERILAEETSVTGKLNLLDEFPVTEKVKLDSLFRKIT